jgi:putative transposase
MNFQPNRFYHVYNRSFNKTKLFYNTANYCYFLKKLSTLTSYCDIIAYCLMPDHFHILIYVSESSSGTIPLVNPNGQAGMQLLTRKLGTILSSYTQAINKQESKHGSLFQPKSKAKELDGKDQPFICFNYIHQNPLKAGLVKKIEDWDYSSFKEYFVCQESMCNKSLAYQLLDISQNPDSFYAQSCAVIHSNLLKEFTA